MAKKIRCVSCKYAQVDKTASEGSWEAYQCINRKSEYYRALLNVSIEGDKAKRITWSGCELGERRDSNEKLFKTGAQGGVKNK